jgi:hypothetical protein
MKVMRRDPMVTKLKAVLDQVFANDQLGGFSLNYRNGMPEPY